MLMFLNYASRYPYCVLYYAISNRTYFSSIELLNLVKRKGSGPGSTVRTFLLLVVSSHVTKSENRRFTAVKKQGALPLEPRRELRTLDSAKQ